MRRHWAWVLLLECCAVPSFGWGNRGHQLVAYLAYLHADADVQTRIDQLVALNPCYTQWQATVAKDAGITANLDKRAALFMLAATWPDAIKHDPANPNEKVPYSCPPGFTFATNDKGKTLSGGMSADVPPNDPAASQNIGYTDTRRHQYWHFVDTPYTTDGSKTYPASTPNAATQLTLLAKALQANDDPKLNSYDLVWIAHLMGDLHQPLHDAERYSKALPNGDQGGNAVKICTTATVCNAELHAYWDGLPGGDAPLHVLMAQAKGMDSPQSSTQLGATDFTAWGNATFVVAKNDAYAKPFDTGAASVQQSAITATNYHAQALKDMQSQIVLAGWRLAQVLNAALGNRHDSCCKLPG